MSLAELFAALNPGRNLEYRLVSMEVYERFCVPIEKQIKAACVALEWLQIH